MKPENESWNDLPPDDSDERPGDPDERLVRQLMQSALAAPEITSGFSAGLMQTLEAEFAHSVVKTRQETTNGEAAHHSWQSLAPVNLATSSELAIASESPILSLPQSNRRFYQYVMTGVAAAALFLALGIWSNRPAYGWAEMLAALERCTWVQTISRLVADQGPASEETAWISRSQGVIARRAGESRVFVDLGRKVVMEFDSKRSTIREQSIVKDSLSWDGEIVSQLLAVQGLPEATNFQNPTQIKLVRESWSRVVSEQHQQELIELQVTIHVAKENGANLAGESRDLVLLIDPQTELPVSARAVFQDRPATRTIRFSYPTKGPGSIYALGVPAEVPANKSVSKGERIAFTEKTTEPDNANGVIVDNLVVVGDPSPKAEVPAAEIPADQAPAKVASNPPVPVSEHRQSRPLPPPLAEDKLVEQVNTILSQFWQAQGVSPVEPASDSEFLRRVYLDLIGRIPVVSEVYGFLDDPGEDRRQRLVDDLLSRRDHATHLAAVWRTILLPEGVDLNRFGGTNKFDAWLADRFGENVAYDDIVRQLLLAEGRVSESGPLLFYAALKLNPEEIAAKTSRVFLGTRMECAQCHDHPYDRWKREQFHELAAFFPRIAVRPSLSFTRRSFEVVGSDRFGRRPPKNERFPTAEHLMPDLENPQAPGTKMEPKFFLTGASVPWGTTDAERRLQLAQWLTANEWFATAVVNRMWAELVGEGFYPTVDDIGPDRTPVAPTAVKLLSRKFAESGYDLKWLIKTICLTEAYQRESRPARGTEGTPFAANVPQRLRSDQLFNSLLSALDSSEELSLRARPQRMAQFSPRGRFADVFAYDPSISREEAVSSIPQVLALMNSPEVNQAVSLNRRNVLEELVNEIPDDEQLTTELYLRCLSRPPTAAEIAAVAEYRSESSNRGEVFVDLAWSLLNSAEFQHRR